MKFLRFKYFGHLPKDAPVKNEAQYKYGAFLCFRFVKSFIRVFHDKEI